jgi:peroxiredoxin
MISSPARSEKPQTPNFRRPKGVKSRLLFLEKTMLRWLLGLVVAVGTTAAGAGEYNPALNVGDTAPGWSKLPGVDGKQHSLEDWKDKKVLVVVFTCNSCPVAVDYEDRMIEFAKRHKADVGMVAINVNRTREDSLEAMRERAEEKKFPFPYLSDESQQIGRAYGAQGTPEFFVLSPERKIVYMGAMDDSADPAQVKVRHLEAAVQAALAGKAPAIKETYAHGCRIRYARERKRK